MQMAGLSWLQPGMLLLKSDCIAIGTLVHLMLAFFLSNIWGLSSSSHQHFLLYLIAILIYCSLLHFQIFHILCSIFSNGALFFSAYSELNHYSLLPIFSWLTVNCSLFSIGSLFLASQLYVIHQSLLFLIGSFFFTLVFIFKWPTFLCCLPLIQYSWLSILNWSTILSPYSQLVHDSLLPIRNWSTIICTLFLIGSLFLTLFLIHNLPIIPCCLFLSGSVVLALYSHLVHYFSSLFLSYPLPLNLIWLFILFFLFSTDCFAVFIFEILN